MADPKAQFLNRLRSLFNIDGDLLPELTDDQQHQFVREPVRYFIGADEAQSTAIWREIQRRQPETDAGDAIDRWELEQTATMLKTYAGEVFPEVNEQGQKHFGRVMMESAAEAILQAMGRPPADAERTP